MTTENGRLRTPRDREIGRYVGARIRAFRLGHSPHISLQAVADEIERTPQQLDKYERGQNRVGAGQLYIIAQVLGVSVDDFFEGLPEV